MIVPPELRPQEVLGVVSPVTRGIDDEPAEDCFPPSHVVPADSGQFLVRRVANLRTADKPLQSFDQQRRDCHVNLAPAERESKGSALVQAAVAARQF